MTNLPTTLPSVRGKLTPNRDLSSLTWLRVGGPADWFFQPADLDDLCQFLKELPEDIEIFPMGVGSNLIVRDGGLRAVVIRLGRGFNEISIESDSVTAGAAALDAHVARKAADHDLDLTFLRTIPGSIGGAVRMNAGCYGSYMADVVKEVQVVTRAGEVKTLSNDALGFGYRQCDLPADWIVTKAVMAAPRGTGLHDKMAQQLTRRDETQPTKDLTAGSTFRNPVGHSSTGAADDVHDLKAWKVIEDAGLRGATMGQAVMNEKHPNFLTNKGGATAAELESLGEWVRKKVYENAEISLEWEIKRVGEPAPAEK